MGEALRYRALGLILCVGGILLSLIAAVVFFGAGLVVALIPTLLAWLCWGLGRESLKRGRRLSAPGAEEILRRDRRSPVLYLRSFEDDAIAARLKWFGLQDESEHLLFVTEEQQLVTVLEEIGPVIAIGRPSEKLPELGAARKQVSDREWKTVVRNDIDNARLVVLRVGDGGPDAYWWEIEQAGLLPPEKVLFVVPHDKRLYSAFCEKAQKALTRLRGALPAYGGREGPVGTLGGFMYFESDWTPRFLALRGAPARRDSRRPLVSMIKTSLQPVFERLGVPWNRPSLSLITVAFAAIGTGIMIVAELVLLSIGPIGILMGLAVGAFIFYWLRYLFSEN